MSIEKTGFDAVLEVLEEILKAQLDGSLEKAQNQPSLDPAELERLRTANEQLIQQNHELTVANRRIADLLMRRLKDIQDLRAENERLRELLAVTDQHAGEIVRALAVAEGESK